MYYRIVQRKLKYGSVFIVQRNKFWTWKPVDEYGLPSPKPKFYKDFYEALDALELFKAPKNDKIVYEDLT